MNGAVGLPLPANSSPSVINMYRIQKVTERLAWLAQPGNRGDPKEFYNHCLSLSRGIDYALANGEIPSNAHELPLLVKQICQLKNDELSQAAMMVLMISVKGACEIGWFQTKESQELLTILDEIGKVYSSMGSINATSRQCSSEISTIMEKFYPHVKLGSILASIEIQPGYGASLVGFHITKSEFVKEKLFLLVAQIDNIEISACLISPPQANFLLNGKGIANRTYVEMDPGPQMPTDVTAMLKFGTNLLQAVGQFNGRYIVLVAYMSFTPLHEDPVLQDYLQPAVTSIDFDSDIVEGASQISLNCPISFTRIKTPVKGRSCKHFQCFDFNNFISINSKRPSWRCPHCNQYVCYADIRLDRNMVEILKNVGESITEVIVLADGSWKAVSEKDHDVDKMQKKAPNHEKEQTEPQEYTCSPATVDLTEDDDHVEAMDSSEIVDRKPLLASIQSHFVAPNSTSLGMNTPGINRNVAGQMDDFLSGVYIACSRSDTPMVGTLELPILPDTISPAFNQESAGRDNNPAVNSGMRNQISGPNNLPMQMNHMNSVNEYGRSSSVPRHINRTPVAVQALPVQSQASGDTLKAILSDTERQQRFSRSPMNLPQVSGVNSPAFRHHNATQQSLNIRPSRQHSNFRPSTTPWSHIQQSVPQSGNLQAAGMAAPPAARQGISNARNVSPAATTAHSQQSRGLAANQPPRWTPLVPVQNQSGAAGTPFVTDSFQGRGNTAHSVSRPDELFSTQPEQNWAPTGRMRGSLDLSQPYDESIAQRIITPTQTQGSRPPPPQPLRRATGSTQQDVLIANNRNANAHNRPST
ncbi:E4 SUMO-protein ligase PIAL2 isoform X4 [Vigna angularis]|uniref:E4 SUMO-protein ligase PIAL2 isoform X4 n=1 Tax=Phaseolus angularis TaxID=3914 RepID=UPI00080A0F73|nr:E4 SUMO-protein ligase PIAL2 isoform X4 [Vigna angularis]